MKVLVLILAALFLFSCEPEPKFLSKEQMEIEKERIIKVNENYNQASEKKDFAAIVETLGDEVTFYGTDSDEVIKSFAEFKESIREQWRDYDRIIYGDMQDIFIKMDDNASIASIIFGVPCEVTRDDITNHYFLRIARTMEKKGEDWFIVSGIVGIARDAMQKTIDYELESNEESE